VLDDVVAESIVVLVVCGTVVVVVVASVVVVVGGTVVVVVVSGTVVVVVSGTVVVVVVSGTVVVVVASVVVVVDVELVVVDVEVVVVVVDGWQCERSVTEVERWAVTLSGQLAFTVNVTLPVDPAGSVVVAEVVPLAGTTAVYPVTANDWAPRVAVALSMCMVLSVSLLPIVQVTTCVPSEHVV